MTFHFLLLVMGSHEWVLLQRAKTKWEFSRSEDEPNSSSTLDSMLTQHVVSVTANEFAAHFLYI